MFTSGGKFPVLTLSYINTALSQSAFRIYKCYIIIIYITVPTCTCVKIMSLLFNRVVRLHTVVLPTEQCGQHSIVQSCFHQYCNNLIVFSRVLAWPTLFVFTTIVITITFLSNVYLNPPRQLSLWEETGEPGVNTYHMYMIYTNKGMLDKVFV